MKEERRAREVRDKIKEKMARSGNEREDALEDKFDQIGDYRIYTNDIIGEGSYGKVFKARKINDPQLLACKVISKAKLENLKLYSQEYAEEMEKRFRTESEFHKQLSGCAHIVRLIETIENARAYYFLMEYCESDLGKIIKEQGILPQEVALRYFSQMLEGYLSIYEKNAFHRDLKPENLLLRGDVVKISDFGFVKIFSEVDWQCKSGKNKLRTESKVGSIKYMAPDVLGLALSETDGRTYSAEKSDVWSMGIILYKMLYGKEPYCGKDEEQMIRKISEKELRFPDTVELSPELIRNSQVSPPVQQLLKKMINKDEASRIGFKQLLTAVKSLMKQREGEKGGSHLDEQGEKGEAKNKREELLIVYNRTMVKVYHDAVNYATLREIGFENYYEITCRLMTLVHEKRTNYLEEEGKEQEEVSDKIKQEISGYHNSFWSAIKNLAAPQPGDSLQSVLMLIHDKIKDYTEFDLLMKQVQIFLIDMLLLLSLQLAIVKPDYVYTWNLRSENYKQKVILNYHQNTLTMLARKLTPSSEQSDLDLQLEKPKESQKESHHRKGRDHSHKKSSQDKTEKSMRVKREKDKEREKEDKEEKVEKEKEKEKEDDDGDGKTEVKQKKTRRREDSETRQSKRESRQKGKEKHSRDKKSKK